ANASDLNKRVVYAYDKRDRVIGRQLIAINKHGKLVGFKLYTNINDKAVSDRLVEIFKTYIQRFALKCHLELADEGDIDTLTTNYWYDDGVVPWSKSTDGAAVNVKKEQSAPAPLVASHN
ncbi:MAG TPA: hypothetical protein V6D17_12350, partial [Candidatus Obscuribacterales bacterium]